MEDEHNKFMLEALAIAFRHMGNTSPNPSVGAVIARNGRVISSGGTCPWGSSHAEIVALRNAGEDLKGADMYVTLEPCNHYGKTPPCTEAIISAGISRVIIPMLDPNPMVAGKGVNRLRQEGVEVVVLHEMADCAADLIRPFKKYIFRKRPFVIHKSAITLDGRIATGSGDSKWISSDYSRYLVHRLRAKADAVIVGKQTFVQDNPSLTVRLDSYKQDIVDYFSRGECAISGRDNYFMRSLFSGEIGECPQPLRVVVGLTGALDTGSSIFYDDNYVIYENESKLSEMIRGDSALKKTVTGLNIVPLPAENRQDSVMAVLEDLGSRGVMLALLEGGGTLAGSFMEAGEIDQFMYFITPRILGNGVSPISGRGVDKIADSLYLRDVSAMMVGDNLLYNGYRETYNFEMM